MLKEFKDIYDIHGWLRLLTWAGLLCMALFLGWVFRLAMSGVLPLHPILLVAALSVVWFLACGFVLWLGLELVRHHIKQWKILDRKRVKQRSKEWKAARESFISQSTGSYGAWQPLPVAMDYTTDGHNGHNNHNGHNGSNGHNGQNGYGTTDPLTGLHLPQRQPTPLPPVSPASPASPVSPTPMPQRAQGKIEPMPLLLSVKDEVAEIPTQVPMPRTSPLPRVEPVTTVVKTRASQSQSQSRPPQSQYGRIGVGWNPGIARRNAPNEDGVAAIQGTCTHKDRIVPFDLLIVADGMGGHADGQEASRIAIQTMTQAVLQSMVTSGELTDASLTEVMTNGVQQANIAIWQRNYEQRSDMGTTLTAALVVGAKAYIMNVGDSRTYLYRPSDGLKKVTRDHSFVARLVAQGAITPEEVYTHPSRNLVERSMGSGQRVEVDSFVVNVHKGDWLLLCSDGLWEMVRDREIERILRSTNNPTQMSDMLIQAALRGGGADNISVIVSRIA